MHSPHRRVAIALMVAATAVSGCGQLDPFDTDAGPVETRSVPDDANNADVEFLRDMVDHLEAGRSLTDAALDHRNDAGDDIERFARHIADEDRSRVVRMRDLLDDWGEANEDESGSPGGPIIVGFTGEAFDQQWVEAMIEHHEHGTVLAEAVKRDGSSRLVDNLASGMLVDLGFEATALGSR